MNIKKVAIIYNDDIEIPQGEAESSSHKSVVDTAREVLRAVESENIPVVFIPLRNDIEGFIRAIKKEDASVIFNLCEEGLGKSVFEMNVAAILEIFGFKFTGSGALTLGIALNKARAKDILYANDIPTAPYLILNESPSRLTTDLRFPLIVKPLREDASIGIDDDAVVKNMAGLKRRVDYIVKNYNQPALVEEYVDGREFNVAVMGNCRPRALPVSEIDFSSFSENTPKICTYEAKWITESPIYINTPPVCPADIPAELEQELANIALRAYNVLGCRDYARVDMRVGEDGIPKVLEVNPNPDISPDAGFARSARVSGLSYSQLIAEIINMAYDRYETARIL